MKRTVLLGILAALAMVAAAFAVVGLTDGEIDESPWALALVFSAVSRAAEDDARKGEDR